MYVRALETPTVLGGISSLQTILGYSRLAPLYNVTRSTNLVAWNSLFDT